MMLCFKVVDVGAVEFKEYDPQIVRVFTTDGSPLPSDNKLTEIKKAVQDTETFQSFMRSGLHSTELVVLNNLHVILER